MLYFIKKLKHKQVTITKAEKEAKGPRGSACGSKLGSPLGRSWVLGCLLVASLGRGLSSLSVYAGT